MENKNEEKIKDLIKQELAFCECKNVPFICANKETPEGESKMIELIYEYVISKNQDISQSIIDVEVSFNPNIADNPYA